MVEDLECLSKGTFMEGETNQRNIMIYSNDSEGKESNGLPSREKSLESALRGEKPGEIDMDNQTEAKEDDNSNEDLESDSHSEDEVEDGDELGLSTIMGIMGKRSLVQTMTKILKPYVGVKKKRGPKSARVKLEMAGCAARQKKIKIDKRICLFQGVMRVLSWNVRGCIAHDKIHLIKHCFDQTRTEIVILIELKLEGEDVERFVRVFKGWKCLIVDSIGASGGLGILWKDSVVDIHRVQAERSWQWVEVLSKELHLSFYLINVYGPNNTRELRFVWESLSEVLVSQSDKPFLLGGDFNAILRPSDKSGGIGWNNQKQRDFSDFVCSNGLK
ncbi:uncharacterized protein LOC131078421 [Cryptomeria japonica]|uniref:uncharacterized protein LOC131078421 n=1 Tax=Cryptomeria japonica TaxID=3369 RepID=UPI0027DA08E6|nr:uncharacterized protein LOC131078421 [Cryptomeria japonica]